MIGPTDESSGEACLPVVSLKISFADPFGRFFQRFCRIPPPGLIAMVLAVLILIVVR